MLLLEADGALSAVTLLEELLRRHPGDYGTAVLRTLQRRVRRWRAMHGPEREVMFAKEHPPGRLGLSDFTVGDELGVVIDGVAFAHRIYQFALAHSGWGHAASRIACSSRAMRAPDSVTECRYSCKPICCAACAIFTVASQRRWAAVQEVLPA